MRPIVLLDSPISKIHRREDVLRNLVPKMLGIICQRGQKRHRFSGCSEELDEHVELSARGYGANRIMLSAYWLVKLKITKVFSAHVTDLPSAMDQKFYRYCGGSPRRKQP
jgi:hypothetical protein